MRAATSKNKVERGLKKKSWHQPLVSIFSHTGDHNNTGACTHTHDIKNKKKKWKHPSLKLSYWSVPIIFYDHQKILNITYF